MTRWKVCLSLENVKGSCDYGAGPRVKSAQRAMGRMRARPKVDEARDILANVVVCHVPVVHYNFQQKVQHTSLLYLCVLPGVFM